MTQALTLTLYGIGAAGALAGMLCAAIAPLADEAGWATAKRLPRIGARFYLALLGVLLLAFRWPVIFDGQSTGIDEGLWISGALTLFKDPIFWRGVDGDSAGPLVFYVLMPLKWCGGLNFVGLKIAATLLLWGALGCSYAGLKAVWGDGWARLAVLPAACFWAFETRLEFVSYSTEHVTLLLLAAGFGGLLRAIAQPEKFSSWSLDWLGAGCALGAVPFAKLQGVPMAGVLIIAGIIWAVTQRTWTGRRRLEAVLVFIGAVWVVPLVFAAQFALGLKWEDFWIPYLELNRARSALAFSSDGGAQSVAWEFIRQSRMFQVLLIGGPVVAFGAAGGGLRPLRQWPLLIIAALLGASVAAALLPAYSFHHLHFLVLPLTLLAGGAVAATRRMPAESAAASARRATWLWVSFLGVLVAPLMGVMLRETAKRPPVVRLSLQPEPGPMAREILRRARAEDRLTVWGTQHILHAQTGLSQGTREANPRVRVVAPRFRDYYRRRYLADLERSRSRFFVDQTSTRPEDAAARRRWGWEADPVIEAYLVRHYELVGEFESMRLFVRKEDEAPAASSLPRPVGP